VYGWFTGVKAEQEASSVEGVLVQEEPRQEVVKKVVEALAVQEELKTAEPTKVVIQQEEPTFLFEGTLEKWQDSIHKLPAEHAAQDARHQAELDRLEAQKRNFKQQLLATTGDDASSELVRRNLKRQISEIASGIEKENKRFRCEHRRTEKSVAKDLRQAEMLGIVTDGNVLIRKPTRTPDEDNINGAQYDRHERVVVWFRDKPWLCHVVTPAKCTTTYEGGGPYGASPYHFKPTGEFLSPRVKWTTQSWDQFKDEEVAAIDQFVKNRS
jgi:hypothetical protein